MSVFVARQPIFDRLRRTLGYELLFRSGPVNVFESADPDRASVSVIDTSFFVLGLETLTGGRPAFVNFTRHTLVNGYAALLPKKLVVVELLEDLEPDEKVLAACRELKRSGHVVALDDVVYGALPAKLLSLADIVKVDFRQNDEAQRAKLVEQCRPLGVKLLAEKVESQEEFRRALDAGFHYFQGYFFSKPVIVTGRTIPANKLNLLRLLQEVHRPDTDFSELEAIIKREVALTYRLLNYMNRAVFAFQSEIESVQQALVLLGESGIKKWMSIVLLADMGTDSPPELLVSSVVRARFCELICARSNAAGLAQSAFLLGLFSHLDVLLERPLDELLDALSIADDIRNALVGGSGYLANVYALALGYERGDWSTVSHLCSRLSMAESEIPDLFVEAVEWGNTTASI